MIKKIESISKKEFYEKIGPRDIVINAVGNYPYVTEFKTRSGTLVGKSIDKEFGSSDYFLDFNEIQKVPALR